MYRFLKNPPSPSPSPSPPPLNPLSPTYMPPGIQPSEVPTEAESITFVKKSLQAGLHSVAFHRKLVAASCFEDHPLTAVTLKRLKRGPNTARFFEWEKDFFAVLKARHLKVMSLVVLSRDKSEVLERYDFKVEYLEGVPTKAEVLEDLRQLVEALQLLTHSMQELPREAVVEVRGLYTPRSGYVQELEEFCAAAPDSSELILGKIQTRSYALNVSCRVPRTSPRSNVLTEQSAACNALHNQPYGTQRGSNKRSYDEMKDEDEEMVKVKEEVQVKVEEVEVKTNAKKKKKKRKKKRKVEVKEEEMVKVKEEVKEEVEVEVKVKRKRKEEVKVKEEEEEEMVVVKKEVEVKVEVEVEEWATQPSQRWWVPSPFGR